MLCGEYMSIYIGLYVRILIYACEYVPVYVCVLVRACECTLVNITCVECSVIDEDETID